MSIKANDGPFTMSSQESRVQVHHIEIYQAIHLHWLLTPTGSKYRYIEISWGASIGSGPTLADTSGDGAIQPSKHDMAGSAAAKHTKLNLKMEVKAISSKGLF